MRSSFLLASAVVLALAAAPVSAEDKPSSTPEKTLSNIAPADAPQLDMPSFEHEFGAVKPGTPLTYTFKFKNRGKSDLSILEVKPSCGCTKGDFDKVVKPGKSGKITLTIDKTEKYSGKTVKTAHVSTNDPEHASFTLTLRADFGPKQQTETLSNSKTH